MTLTVADPVPTPVTGHCTASFLYYTFISVSFFVSARPVAGQVFPSGIFELHFSKGLNPDYGLEGPMLKLQYSGHLMQRTNS